LGILIRAGETSPEHPGRKIRNAKPELPNVSRFIFLLLAAFWITMNVLLWRSEIGARGSGSAMPPEVVWQKILTAPDSSSLTIVQHGTRIGYCHWSTAVGDQWGNVTDENLPTGLPGKLPGYRLHIEGSGRLIESTNQVRFDGHLTLDQKRSWQEVLLRLHVRPLDLEILSKASEQSVHVKGDSGGARFQATFTSTDLQNPALLLNRFTTMPAEWLDEIKSPAGGGALPAMGLKWEAHEDTLQVGHSRMRIYRLQTRVLDRFEAKFYVSRVGEILRIELPDDLVFVNDSLFIL
jgi:hypothetical protein